MEQYGDYCFREVAPLGHLGDAPILTLTRPAPCLARLPRTMRRSVCVWVVLVVLLCARSVDAGGALSLTRTATRSVSITQGTKTDTAMCQAMSCGEGYTGRCCEVTCETMCMHGMTSAPNCMQNATHVGDGRCACEMPYYGVICELNWNAVAIRHQMLVESYKDKGQVAPGQRILIFFVVMAIFLVLTFLFTVREYRGLKDTSLASLEEEDNDVDSEEEEHAAQATAVWETSKKMEKKLLDMENMEDAHDTPSGNGNSDNPPPTTSNLLWNENPWPDKPEDAGTVDHVLCLVGVLACVARQDLYATQTDALLFAEWVIGRYGGTLTSAKRHAHGKKDQVCSQEDLGNESLSAQDVLFVLHFNRQLYETEQRSHALTTRDDLSFDSAPEPSPGRRSPTGFSDAPYHERNLSLMKADLSKDALGTDDNKDGLPGSSQHSSERDRAPQSKSPKSSVLTNPLVPLPDAHVFENSGKKEA